MSTPPENFAGFGLADALLRALDEVGYEAPSPIQAACFPPLLAGEDVLGQAQTGTGKTAAFALPLLQRLDPTVRAPQALVLTPTRELALQVTEALARYGKHLPGISTLAVYGGQGMGQQLQGLRNGVHVVVGTPGRVMDHVSRGTLDLAGLRMLVLDEADEMLRMGFIDDVEWLLQHMPDTRQMALFSATLPEPIRVIARNHMHSPREIRIESATATVELVRQRYWQVRELHKQEVLTRLLEAEDVDAALVFVRTKVATSEVADGLVARGFAAAALHGDMNQQDRERTIAQLKSGRLDVVVATDVAARGLDVARISHVINYDVPLDVEAYVHRIGRTGRAGRAGEAILFAFARELRMVRIIERATGQPIEPMAPPTLAMIAERRRARFDARVRATLASAGQDAKLAQRLDFVRAHLLELCSSDDLEPLQLAALLAHLAETDSPAFLTPGEIAELEPERPRSNRESPWADRVVKRRETPGAFGKAEAPLAAPSVSSASAPQGEPFAAEQRRERAPRDETAPRQRAPRQAREPAQDSGVPMGRYRIELGREHQIEVRQIVGAIANEGGIDGRFIQRIDVRPFYTLLDLPADMPRDLLRFLGKVRIGKHQLRLSLADDEQLDSDEPPRRSRSEGRDAPRERSRPPARPGGRGAYRDNFQPRPRSDGDRPPQRFSRDDMLRGPARPERAGPPDAPRGASFGRAGGDRPPPRAGFAGDARPRADRADSRYPPAPRDGGGSFEREARPERRSGDWRPSPPREGGGFRARDGADRPATERPRYPRPDGDRPRAAAGGDRRSAPRPNTAGSAPRGPDTRRGPPKRRSRD